MMGMEQTVLCQKTKNINAMQELHLITDSDYKSKKIYVCIKEK